MNWSVYQILPIDFGWENLKSIKDTIIALVNFCDDDFIEHDLDCEKIQQFVSDWNNAKKLASDNGWQGDFRDEPCVFWLPAENQFIYAFVFKQDNNGDTFVVSPLPLPWLSSCV